MELTARSTRAVTVSLLASVLSGLAGAQTTLRITSPADGSVVNPGQSVSVTVAATGQALKGVFIIGANPIGFSKELAAPPYVFTIEIPKEINSGLYNLTAEGYAASKLDVKPDTVTVDVERADSPVSLRVEVPFLRLYVGQNGYIGVSGVFGDGTTTDLKKSSLTRFESDKVGVTTVQRYGIVMAVAPGSARITITNGKARVEVPVTVLRDNEHQ